MHFLEHFVSVAAAPSPAVAPVVVPTAGGKVGASPLAKRLAAEKGIDLQVQVTLTPQSETTTHSMLQWHMC